MCTQTSTHTRQSPVGKHHHTRSQRSPLCQQHFLISITLLFNFLFVPNWKSEVAVFLCSSTSAPLICLDIKHGLAASKVPVARHDRRGRRHAPPQRPLISRLLTPCLYVRTHWSVSLLNVKCITCHLRGRRLIFRRLISK